MGKTLFDRVKLGSIELKNRLIRSATWEGLADISGHLPETLYDTNKELAKGGIGAIFTGFTSIADDDRCFGGMARLSDDDLIPGHQRLTGICHAENCPVIAQLALGEYDGGVEPDFMSADVSDLIFSALSLREVSQAARQHHKKSPVFRLHSAEKREICRIWE